MACLWKAVFSSVFKSGQKKNRFFRLTFNHARWLFQFLTLALIFLLWMSMRNLSREIGVTQEPETTDIPVVDTTRFVFAKKPDAMVKTNTIDISGEAANDVILSLKVNGHLQAVVFTKNNRFEFENVHLTHGSNEIIIQGFDSEGRSEILETITTRFGTPRFDYLSRDYTRGNVSRARIALTFDGGSESSAAHEILEYLLQKNVKCTIFLTGQFIRRYPLLVTRMVEEGHEIANHTWSHPHLTTFAENGQHNTRENIDRAFFQEQLTKTAEFFYNMTKREMLPYWRAPYGEHNLEIRRWAAEIGYTHVGWTLGQHETLDSFDWVSDSSSAIYNTSEEILAKLLNFGNSGGKGANGGIILMHLHTQRRDDPVHEIIPALIDSMRSRGYEFVKVSELMKS